MTALPVTLNKASCAIPAKPFRATVLDVGPFGLLVNLGDNDEVYLASCRVHSGRRSAVRLGTTI